MFLGLWDIVRLKEEELLDVELASGLRRSIGDERAENQTHLRWEIYLVRLLVFTVPGRMDETHQVITQNVLEDRPFNVAIFVRDKSLYDCLGQSLG